jgi:Ca-activated chloride channel family protein
MTRLTLISALLSAVLVSQGTPQQPVFRGGTQTVPVYVTVTDKSGRLVTDLTKDDFEVRDSGKPQPITVFENTPQPIRLIVMIDVSGSMAGYLPLLRTGAMELFKRLLPDDLARVGWIGDQITISPTFINDPNQLQAALPTEISGSTPLWKALDQAISAFEGVQGRRVILVLSDGVNAHLSLRQFHPLEVIDRAEREDIMIYAIGLAPRTAELLSRPDPQLAETALATGGGYSELRPRDNLGVEFARIADELHRQYLIGFRPTALDGKLHKIEVRTRNGDLKPRARKSYLAPKKPEV